MKGIILAGGTGTRLYPATKVLNKHIIPLFDKPMIYYPLSVIMLSGIRNVIIVCNPYDYESYDRLLGNGNDLGICIKYVLQKESKGIVDGILLCKEYFSNESVMVALGDNVFYGQTFTNILRKAIQLNRGATVFSLFQTYNYGITTVKCDDNKKPVSLIFKNKALDDFIVPGLYIYNSDLFDIAEKIEPVNGTKQMISINIEYLRRNLLDVIQLSRGMFWYDVGTTYARLDAEIMISKLQQNQGLYVGCIEEIAYNQNWISKEHLLFIVNKMADNTPYKNYLLKVLELRNDTI